MSDLQKLREAIELRRVTPFSIEPDTVLALLSCAEALAEAEKLDTAGWLMHPAVVAKARDALAQLKAAP